MESQISLVGYVGNDVEFSAGDGWQAARFRLGCTPRWRKGIAWVNGETTWMTIRTYGNTALNVRDSVRKGDPMLVSGRLRTRIWKTVDGVKREQLVVEAYSLGHDLSRGVSTYIRPERIDPSPEEDEPLGPSEEDEAIADTDLVLGTDEMSVKPNELSANPDEPVQGADEPTLSDGDLVQQAA